MNEFLRRLNGGDPVFSKPPFDGREGAHMRTLFSFTCEAPDWKGRASSGEFKALGIKVPQHVHRSAKEVVLRQETNLTAVMTRYMAAHVELSFSAKRGPSAPGGESKEEDPYSEKYISGACPWWPYRRILPNARAPLAERPGRRLRELFRFACGPRRPDARTELDQSSCGFRAPSALKKAFDSVQEDQDPPSTEILVRYLALHVFLSNQAF